jgi:ATP-dependent Lon protease
MEIPLFPLPNLVLFPGVVVPLHIFEDRYKLMITACIDSGEPFGIVLLREGGERESEETIHRVGVTARVVDVERLPEGRLNILTEGQSRFRIIRYTQQIPFWQATVSLFEDIESAAPLQSLYDQVSEGYRKVVDLGAKLGISEESEVSLPGSPADLSFMVSYVLDIASEDKQKLLEMTSTAERLRAVAHHLNDTLQSLQQRLELKAKMTKIRGNGDLGKPTGT